MDQFRKSDAYGFDTFDDSCLRTNADEFQFKYVPKEQFKDVIKMVHRDRLKLKKKWADLTPHPSTTSIEYPHTTAQIRRSIKSTGKQIIKTPKSTIKILTHPMLDKITDREEPPESKKLYEVPRIRIMTDDEIQKVIENAIKEVMDQNDDYNESTVRSIQHFLDEMDSPNPPDLNKNIISEPNEDESKNEDLPCSSEPKQSPPEEVKDELIHETEEENPVKPENEPQDFNEEINVYSEDISESNLHTLTKENSADNSSNDNVSFLYEGIDHISVKEDAAEKSDDNCENIRSERSISLYSVSNSSAKSVSIKNKEDNEENQEQSDTEKNNKDEVRDPTLTSLEREELRILLGIRETIENSNIDLDGYNESSSSDDNVEEGKTEEVKNNFVPVIHIRHSPNHMIESDSDDKDDTKTFQQNDDSNSPIRENKFDQTYRKKTKKSQIKKEPPKNVAHDPPVPKRGTSPLSRGTESRSISSRSSAKSKMSSGKKTTGILQITEEIPPIKTQKLHEERLEIFSKITSYQEKIIDLLDQLRISLLNLSLPDGQPDRRRRESQVIEFTARFGRNYLYQLDRMIKEIDIVHKDQYLNKYDNEHRNKICVIYGILFQATQTYLKQIKYFLINQCPRKLDVLVEYIRDTTKICISKRVFDKNDKVVACLLDRCDSVLGFLVDLKEQRTYALSQKSRKQANSKTILDKWDVPPKSKLSMYEPSPYAPQKRKILKKTKTKKKANKNETLVPINSAEDVVKASSSTEDIINKIKEIQNSRGGHVKMAFDLTSSTSSISFPEEKEEEMLTQVEKAIKKDSATLLSSQHSLSNEDLSLNYSEPPKTDHEEELKASIFQALQTITKQQVHQMLGPIVCDLGNILNEKRSALDLETLLNSLNSGNSQVVKRTPTGSNTYDDRENNTEHNCGDGKSLRSRHAVSSERRLDLSQSKHRARALNRRLSSPPSGEGGDVVSGTSLRRIELPETNRTELPTIEEERFIRPPSTVTLEGEGGASGLPLSTNRTGKKLDQIRYDKNIQFTFVSSEDDYAVPEGMNMGFNLPLNFSDQDLFEDEYKTPKIEEEARNAGGLKEIKSKKNKEDLSSIDGILADRLNFIQQIAENPLYVNENFAQPWKVITRLTNRIVEEEIYNIGKSILFDENSYLEDFLRMEMGF